MSKSSMFFTDKKRKKNLLFALLALFIFSGAIFVFADVHSVYAADRANCDTGFTALLNGTTWSCVKGNVGIVAANVGDTALWPFKALVYLIFVVFGWMGSLALSIFEWAIDPNDITILFDSPGVYESWKFVRDFFNLFFILVLLYIAFTVVFQINKDFKKAILSLVLAALFINFSFPVSRFLIDATNVPMYFFANQMGGRTAAEGTGVFGGVLTASHLKEILIPDAVGLPKTDFSRLIMATIFMFLFSVTLLVLSIMFVIRLVALVVLVIFSSVGFAASIIPGMGQYSKMWWDNFWKYAIFGPAAMLMLLVAMRFFASIGGENSALTKSVKVITAGTVTAPEQTFFSGMVLFTIPIIMIWFAMGLAQKMSIAGAESVVGAGKKFSKWVGKQASGYNVIKRNVDAFAAARKKRNEEKNKNNFGSRLGKTFNKTQDTLYGATGLPGSKAARERAKKMDTAQNKEDIKNKSEEHEGTGTPTLVTNVSTAITTPPTTKDGLIEAAGQVKQALSRGKEFELEIEAQVAGGTIVLPAGVVPPPLPPGVTPGTAAANNFTNDFIKRWYYTQMRKIVAGAEKA